MGRTIQKTKKQRNIMKIVYIGYCIDIIHQKVRNGKFSSQLLYGGIELEKKGIEVSYYSQKSNGIIGIMKDIANIKKRRANVLFFPYLSGLFYVLLAIAKKTRYLKKELLIGILHTTPRITTKNKLYITKIYKVFDKVYFHSPQNMEECIKLKIINRQQAEILHWGTDLKYIDSLEDNGEKNDCFISTGIENRDYNTLINSFKLVSHQIQLNIYVYNNSTLNDNKAENVNIHYIPQDSSNQYYTAQKTKKSRAVMIPINDKGLTYCTGHTSIIEAMALSKAIIVTDNPYHPIDVEKERIGIKVKPYDPESWKQAILYATTHEKEMEEMGQRGRKLAESTYNINVCAEQIYKFIISKY